MPVLECEQNFFIEVGTKALQTGLGDDIRANVDHNSDNHVSFGVWQFPRISHWIESSHRQRWTNFVAEKGATIQRAVESTCLRAVSYGRKRLSLGIVLGICVGERIQRRRQLRRLSRSLPGQLLMAQPLVTVTLGSAVGGTLRVVVG